MEKQKISCVKDLNFALFRSFEEIENILLIGEDLFDPYGGAFNVTIGLSTKFPNRVYSSPISEAAITGIGIGLAMRGQRVIVEIMFGDFITLAFDQIVNHAAKFPFMYGKYLELPIVIRTPMGGYRGYGPTHSQSLEKYLLGIPGIKVIAMNHFSSPGELLQKAIYDNTPVIFCENKMLYPMNVGINHNQINIDFTDDYYPSVILNNNSDIEKTDVSLISYGGLSKIIEPLLIELVEDEIWIDILFVSEISNVEKICKSILSMKSKNLLFVEEGTAQFNWSSGIIAELVEMTDVSNHKITTISAKHTIIPASTSAELQVLPTQNSIKEKIFGML